MPNNHFLNLKDDQVVLFVDIIGFSNIVMKSQNTEWEDKNIKGLMIHLPALYNILTSGDFSHQYQKQMGIKFLWVSDSIIISCDKANVNNMLITLHKLINQLYCTGFAIKGGISVGKLYHENNIWGVPMIKAVQLEKQAVYPRVIISSDDFSKLDISDRYRSFFKLIENDYLYYDYFASFFSEQVDHNKNISSYLNVYSTLIVDNFNECTENAHKEKWRWLARELGTTIQRHNDFINEMLEHNEVYSSVTTRRITNAEEYVSY